MKTLKIAPPTLTDRGRFFVNILGYAIISGGIRRLTHINSEFCAETQDVLVNVALYGLSKLEEAQQYRMYLMKVGVVNK